MNGAVIGEVIRRQWTSIAFVSFVVLTALMGVAASQIDDPAHIWPAWLGLLSLIIGCQIIGPEFSSGTLQLILAKPVNRATYLLSRVAGVVLTLWMAAALPMIIELIGRALSSRDSAQLAMVAWSGFNVALDAVLVCSLLALFGSFTRSYFNIAVYMGLKIGLTITITGAMAIAGMSQATTSTGLMVSLGRFLFAHPAIIRGMKHVNENLFPTAPHGVFDRNWTLMVLSNAAVALLLACVLFRRREVPYGAD
jgi:ABC-type transport system involved in multi-copper enzyme maturation permease subunit